MCFYFTLELHIYVDLCSVFVVINTWPLTECVQFKIDWKNWSLSKNLQIGQFTSLICRGIQRIVPRIIFVTCAQPLSCSLNLLFGDVLVADVVVLRVRSVRDWPEKRLKYRRRKVSSEKSLTWYFMFAVTRSILKHSSLNS